MTCIGASARRAVLLLLAAAAVPACGGGGGGGGGGGSPGPGLGFDAGGILVADLGGRQGLVFDLATDGASLYVVGTQETAGPPFNNEWRIEKRSVPDGVLVPAFGVGGVVTRNPSGANDAARGIALDGAALYVGGTQQDPAVGTQVLWRVEKLDRVTGALVTGFASGGTLTVDPSARGDALADLVVSGGALYLVGTDESPGVGDTQWRIEKRNASDGGLFDGSDGAHSPVFGAGGVVTVNPTAGWNDDPRGAAVDSGFLFVVGDEQGDTMRIEKRSTADGTLDSGFGTGGVVSFSPSSFFNWLDDVVTDGTYLYVAGLADDSVTGPGDWKFYLEKRLLTTGARDNGFGTSGVVTSNVSSTEDFARGLVLDGSNLYVLGTDEQGGNAQWRLEKRNTTNGGLDPAFGNSGSVQSNPSGSAFEEAYAAVVVGTNLYIAGHDYGFGARWRLERRIK